MTENTSYSIDDLLYKGEVKYKGRTYPTRHIMLDKACLVIGTLSLKNALMTDEEPNDSTAERIDEGICYYVEDKQILLPRFELSNLVEKECYDGKF